MEVRISIKNRSLLLRSLLGLSILFLGCSGCPETSQRELPTEHESTQPLSFTTGLKIETGINRGITPHHSQDIRDFLLQTTTSITNDSTVPIKIELAISDEYEFPSVCNDGKYRVFLFPEVTPDTDSLTNRFNDFKNSFFENPYSLKKTLQPHEKLDVTIGCLYPAPTNCGVVPNAVFSHEDKELYGDCSRQEIPDGSIDSRFEIRLKLGIYYENWFGAPPDTCIIVPVGKISYPEH